MGTQVYSNDLSRAVAVGLTCVEQGLERRQVVNAELLSFIEARYIRTDHVPRVEDIPVDVLDRLHKAFGFCFEAHGGKLTVCLA